MPFVLRPLVSHVPLVMRVPVPFGSHVLSTLMLHMPYTCSCTLHAIVLGVPYISSALMSQVLRVLHASLSRVSHVLDACVPYVHLTLRAFVSHMPHVLRAFMPHLCHVSHVSHFQYTLIHLMFYLFIYLFFV